MHLLRSAGGVLLSVSQDRQDMQYAVTCVVRDFGLATGRHLATLRTVARYLLRCPYVVVVPSSKHDEVR